MNDLIVEVDPLAAVLAEAAFDWRPRRDGPLVQHQARRVRRYLDALA